MNIKEACEKVGYIPQRIYAIAKSDGWKEFRDGLMLTTMGSVWEQHANKLERSEREVVLCKQEREAQLNAVEQLQEARDAVLELMKAYPVESKTYGALLSRAAKLRTEIEAMIGLDMLKGELSAARKKMLGKPEETKPMGDIVDV